MGSSELEHECESFAARRGGSGTDDGGNVLGDTWLFDGADWTAVATSSAPFARQSPGGASFGGEAVLFGGGLGTGLTADDTWVFDGSNWMTLGVSGPSPRGGESMTLLGNSIVLFGGYNPFTQPVDLADTWTFSGTSWMQVPSGTSPAGRWYAPFAAFGNEAMLYGGSLPSTPAGPVIADDMWAFSGSQWMRICTACQPGARTSAVMAWSL